MTIGRRKRSWSTEQLKSSVETSTSYAQVLQKIGLRPTGGNYLQIKKYIGELELDTGHFLGRAWARGAHIRRKPVIPLEKILVYGSTYQSFKLKRRLFAQKLKPMYCERCGWAKQTADGYLPLELDHINGDRRDNRLENLQILCPNCHSLTTHYRGRKNKKCLGGGIGIRATLKMLWSKDHVGSIPAPDTPRKTSE